MAEVKLSKETKSRIRAPWSKALIVKVYGRSIGFNYLTFKINVLWKPMAKIDCVNLGKDFFLIRFSNSNDYDKVLRGDPWFIGEHFLAIKPWEPYFKAIEAITAINRASLGRIRVAYTREEASGFQKDGHDPHGELPNFEVDSNHGSCIEMQRALVLQKGRNGHSKIHDDMEARLGCVQGSTEEDGMEYGGCSYNKS
nr:hypothetical protein CFP56_73770 [Quercus suber]POE64412.1 hypothetical protein CFP56_12457 [Quercus suber]